MTEGIVTEIRTGNPECDLAAKEISRVLSVFVTALRMVLIADAIRRAGERMAESCDSCLHSRRCRTLSHMLPASLMDGLAVKAVSSTQRMHRECADFRRRAEETADKSRLREALRKAI